MTNCMKLCSVIFNFAVRNVGGRGRFSEMHMWCDRNLNNISIDRRLHSEHCNKEIELRGWMWRGLVNVCDVRVCVCVRDKQPGVVVYPQSTEHVSACVQLCSDNSVPIVPFGTGRRCCSCYGKYADLYLSFSSLSIHTRWLTQVPLLYGTWGI